MSSVVELFEMAQMAEAAYSELVDRVIDADDLAKKLTAGDGFSVTQATAFSNRWAVADFQANTTSGFSATLYQRLDKDGNKTGEYSLAIRGTEFEFSPDVIPDLVWADLGGVAIEGSAENHV